MVTVDDARVEHATPDDAVLVDPRRTAEREQARQVRRAGRSGVLATLAAIPHAVRHLGTAEAATAGLRYQQVVWAVIAVVAIAFFVPGRDDGAPARGSVQVASSPVAGSPSTSVSPRDSVVVATTVPSVVAQPTVPPRVAPSPGAQAPRPATAVVAPIVPSRDPAPVPLTVRGHAWFGTTGALGATTVPDGALPVAARVGATDKVSLVRLAGTATTLTLAEDTTGANEPLGAAVVKLCVVEGEWEEAPGQQLADAPAWSDTCVEGAESDDTWTFDLSGLGDPASESGFALVPGDAAPAEFQVTFAP